MWWKIISWHQNVSLQFTESLLKAALTWKALFRNIFQCFPWIQCSVKWHLEDIHCLLSACLAPFQDNLKKTVEFCLLQLLIGTSSQAQEKHNLAEKGHCLFVSRLFFPFCSFPTFIWLFSFSLLYQVKSQQQIEGGGKCTRFVLVSSQKQSFAGGRVTFNAKNEFL